MPSYQLIKTDIPLFKKNLTTNLSLALTALFLLCLFYAYMVQAFIVVIAAFIGSLTAFFYFKYQTQADIKIQQESVLYQLKQVVALSIRANENFNLHQQTLESKTSYPWECSLNFYEFTTLPVIEFKNLNFLQSNEEGQQLFNILLNFSTQITILCNALQSLQKLHFLHLEKLNLWESRIKTMKGIKAMQSRELGQLKEKIGATFVNELEYVSQLTLDASLNIGQQGTDIMNALNQHLK